MRIIKSEKVQMICQKHGFVDHWEYTKDDGRRIYKCGLCYKERPYEYPLYGRQQPSVTSHKLEESKPQQYGRMVA